jgi:hypothetical protein
MNKEINVNWMDETIERFPGKQGFYRILCLMFLKRRLTYSNIYVFTYGIYKNKYKDNEIVLKERIIKELAMIYYYNNKCLPDGFEYTEK